MLLFFIIAEGARAQMIGLPNARVTLAGTPTAPQIVNGSSHRILRYTLVEQGTSGAGRPRTYDMIRQFINDPRAGIAPGATFSEAQLVHAETRDARGAPPPPPIQVLLDSILFDNGVLVGPDKFNSYDAITAMLRAQRDINQAVGAGNWSKLQQIAAAGGGDIGALSGSRMYERNYRLFVVSTARELLTVRDRSSDAAAVKLAASLASFPTISRGQQ